MAKANLYQPKDRKLWRSIKRSNHLTLNQAVIKAVTRPILKAIISGRPKDQVLLTKSKPVAANMVGKANKKLNSTMVDLFNPRAKPPTMVAADREMPGIMARA